MKWDELTPRERDAHVSIYLFSHVEPTAELLRFPESGAPRYTTSLDACRLVEEEIARRGLVEKYQDALIDILDLTMQVFSSAIELDIHNPPNIPNNYFGWEGHAYLWAYSQATADQRCQAALRAIGVEI